jgi:hypothetical protein
MMGVSALARSQIRVGTKIVIVNWIFTLVIIAWLVVILPALAIWSTGASRVLGLLNVSALLGALVGQAGLVTIANEARKAIENRRLPGRPDPVEGERGEA